MKEDKEKQVYSQSLKNTSLLGGVQFINILVTIIRSKFIAILLGPTGMGIHGLLTSTTNTITAFTNLGLATSAVKDIAQANVSGDISRISRVITIFRKLVWATGLLGMLVCLFFAPYISVLTFNNLDYSIAFIFLSITLLLTQLSAGQVTLMQGMRKFAWIAKASLCGSVTGLFISIPLYYFFKIDAIVPVIIIASVTTLFFSWRFSRKIEIEKISITFSTAFREGKEMIKMGFFLGLQGALLVLSSYIVRIFVSNIGGVAEVGLYTAGFTIVNTYVGLIFNAMATEYYPRLSTYANSKEEFARTINQQMEISILLLSPIIITFIIFVDLGIILLYSKDFLSIDSMLYFTILGMFFRAPAWCIAFSFLAKGDTKAFFINELFAIIYTTLLNIFFYGKLGLTGMGISFLTIYVIYWLQVKIVCSKRYSFKIYKDFWKIYIPHLLLSIAGLFLLLFIESKIAIYVVGIFLIIMSITLSFLGLNKRVGLLSIIKSKIKK